MPSLAGRPNQSDGQTTWQLLRKPNQSRFLPDSSGSSTKGVTNREEMKGYVFQFFLEAAVIRTPAAFPSCRIRDERGLSVSDSTTRRPPRVHRSSAESARGRQRRAGLGGLMDQGLGLGGGDKDDGICVSRHAGLAYDDDCQDRRRRECVFHVLRGTRKQTGRRHQIRSGRLSSSPHLKAACGLIPSPIARLRAWSSGFDTTRLSLWEWCRLRGAGQACNSGPGCSTT